jgi:hypothetical protein
LFLTKTKTHGHGLVEIVDSSRRDHGVEFTNLHGLFSVGLHGDIDILDNQTLQKNVILRTGLSLRIPVVVGDHFKARENLQSMKAAPVLKRVDVLLKLGVKLTECFGRE